MVIYSVKPMIELRSWERMGLRTALHYFAQAHIYQCRLAFNANGPMVDIAVLAFLDIFQFPPSVTKWVAFEIQITQYRHRWRCSLSAQAACRNSPSFLPIYTIDFLNQSTLPWAMLRQWKSVKLGIFLWASKKCLYCICETRGHN